MFQSNLQSRRFSLDETVFVGSDLKNSQCFCFDFKDLPKAFCKIAETPSPAALHICVTEFLYSAGCLRSTAAEWLFKDYSEVMV